jgi:cobalt-zinc-cadmium efflux system outer membrane protein
VPVLAQEVSPEPQVTLTELVQRALTNHPQLSIAKQTQNAAQQRLQAARSFPNPTLELTPRLSGNREASDSEVLLSQPIDLFGKRRAIANVKEAELRGAVAKSTFAERSLIIQVKQAAIDLFATQEAESLGDAQVEMAQKFHDAAKRRAELGDVPPVQAQRAELELLRAQNELANAASERLAQLAVVNQLIGQTPAMPLRVSLPEISQITDSGKILPKERGQFLTEALKNRPDLLMAQAELEARQAEVDVIRKERLPDFALQARRGSFFGEEGSYALRAVVTMPIFDFGSIKNERRAAESEARAQQAAIDLLRTQVSTQVEQALLRLQQQWQNVRRYRSGIVPQTLDLLRKTQIGYEQGASSYLEVLEAQRTLRQVQNEYLQALAGTLTSETALENALGTTLPAGMSSLSLSKAEAGNQ